MGFPFWTPYYKCPGHPKNCFFIWQTWWGRMPTNANLNFRIPSFSKHCTFCLNYTEDMNHILRICPRATEIWDALKFDKILSCSFNAWLRRNLTVSDISSHAQVPLNVIFCFALWFIWIRRNSWVFEKEIIKSCLY